MIKTYDVGQRALKTDYLLRQNIRALLMRQRMPDSALAAWCGHEPSWLSKILSGGRGVRLVDLGRIADFFGLTVAQLFQPGISTLTEQRKGDRRKGRDRRIKDRRDPGKRNTQAYVDDPSSLPPVMRLR